MQRIKWYMALSALFLVMVTFMLPLTLGAQDNMIEAHKETILRINEEGFNQGNLDVIDEVVASDYISYGPDGTEGNRESFKGTIQAFRSAIPDLEASMDLMVAEGDWVSVRQIITGTFENEMAFFPGVPPTGELIEFAVHVTVRFNEEGQLVEEWDMWDNLGFLTQFGVIPPMGEETSE